MINNKKQVKLKNNSLADKKELHNYFFLFTRATNRILNIFESLKQINEQTVNKKFKRYSQKYKKNKENKAIIMELSKTLHLIEALKGSQLLLLLMEYEKAIAIFIKDLLLKKPELLKIIDKEIKTTEIWELSNINELREHIINEEINLLLRRNPFEQIKWIEGKFNCNILNKGKMWERIFTFSEQRNAFIHNDNKVTQEYLNKLKKTTPKNGFPKIGEKLSLTKQDLWICSLCIIAGLYTLNRKLCEKYFPEEYKKSKYYSNDWIYYKFVENKESTSFAPPLIDYLLDFDKNNMKNVDKLYLLINKALSEKIMKNKTNFNLTIKKIESIQNDDMFIKLAILLLNEKYDEVEKLMFKLAKNDYLKKMIKQQIFFDFSRTKRFKKIIQKLFK